MKLYTVSTCHGSLLGLFKSSDKAEQLKQKYDEALTDGVKDSSLSQYQHLLGVIETDLFDDSKENL